MQVIIFTPPDGHKFFFLHAIAFHLTHLCVYIYWDIVFITIYSNLYYLHYRGAIFEFGALSVDIYYIWRKSKEDWKNSKRKRSKSIQIKKEKSTIWHVCIQFSYTSFVMLELVMQISCGIIKRTTRESWHYHILTLLNTCSIQGIIFRCTIGKLLLININIEINISTSALRPFNDNLILNSVVLWVPRLIRSEYCVPPWKLEVRFRAIFILFCRDLVFLLSGRVVYALPPHEGQRKSVVGPRWPFSEYHWLHRTQARCWLYNKLRKLSALLNWLDK